MNKVDKGKKGYINHKKKNRLLQSLIMFSIVCIIFFIGFVLNDYSKANYFTVVAILLVLPSTKILINYIVLFPYHSVSEENYKKVQRYLHDDTVFFTDCVLSSPEKIMNLDFLVIEKNTVIGLIGREKDDKEYIRMYLEKGIKSRAIPYEVKICSNLDTFIKGLKELNHNNMYEPFNIGVKEELIAYLHSLLV